MFFEVLVVTSMAKTATEHAFDGDEQDRLTVIRKSESHGWSRIDQKLHAANDNAPFEMRLAA